MKIILREDVPELGTSGDIVTVKNGYGRNYLIPNQMAVQANTKNLSKIRKEATTLAQDLDGVSCTIPMLVGEQDKLFGSVTSKDIEEALAQEGIKLSRKRIILDEPIRSLGVYTVAIRLHTEVTGKLKVWVVAK